MRDFRCLDREMLCACPRAQQGAGAQPGLCARARATIGSRAVRPRAQACRTLLTRPSTPISPCRLSAPRRRRALIQQGLVDARRRKPCPSLPPTASWDRTAEGLWHRNKRVQEQYTCIQLRLHLLTSNALGPGPGRLLCPTGRSLAQPCSTVFRRHPGRRGRTRARGPYC